MHYYSISCLGIAVLAALFGASKINAGETSSIANIVAVVFLVLSVLFFIIHLFRKVPDIPPFSKP